MMCSLTHPAVWWYLPELWSEYYNMLLPFYNTIEEEDYTLLSLKCRVFNGREVSQAVYSPYANTRKPPTSLWNLYFW